MENEALLVIRWIFAGLFIAILGVGVYLLRNHERFFGVDPSSPSETSSSRSYSTMQVFVIWAHAAFLTGAFALLLH
jgi:hypothetical protein